MANDNEATVVLKGDSTQLVGENKKLEQSFKGAARGAADIGTALDKTVTKLGRALVGAGILKQALMETGRAIEAAQQQLSAASKSAGALSVRRDQAAAKLGIKSSDITQVSGVGGQEGQVSLLESLAKSKQVFGLDASGINQAMAVSATGAFSNEDIVTGLENGQPLTVEAANARIGGFSKFSQMEIDRQRAAGRQDETIATGTTRDAAIARAGQRGQELNEARDPILSRFGIRNTETLLKEIVTEMKRQTQAMPANKLNLSGATDQ